MAANVSFTNALQDEYRQLFALAAIKPEYLFSVDKMLGAIFAPAAWDRYKAVEAAIGVPAHVVGIIHSLEASLRFDRHLHNGDPLTARTVQVPRGRPTTGSPPFTWEVSAADALTQKKLQAWTDWSAAGIAYVLEGYNGWGYRLYHGHVKSPYLWSFSTIYSAGKYVADGTWSDVAVSKQCGGMALLKRMAETGRIALDLPAAPADQGGVAVTPRVPADEVAAPSAAAPPYPGQVLKLNSSGDAVKALQARLLTLGIREAGGADGDFGEKTEWGVKLFQARGVDAAGDPLDIDGVVGRKTWEALFGTASLPAGPVTAAPAAGSLSSALLEIAAGEVGVRESPLGSNRGPKVDLYLNGVDSGLLGQPWCMAFVYWCFGQAAARLGRANPAPRTASVWRSWELAQALPGLPIVSKAQATRDPSLVKPGMIFYIDTGGRSGHTGIVADIVDGKLVTIEGNTNDDGSREGIGVFTRTRRRIDSINLGFIAFG